MIDVTCAIIMKKNKILVAQRSERMSLPLKWEFPGGKIEEWETPEDCLKRELKEELNIEIKILRRLTATQFNYGSFSINLIPFLSEYLSGEISLTEHSDFKWLEKEMLQNLDWAAADLPILEEFIKLEL